MKTFLVISLMIIVLLDSSNCQIAPRPRPPGPQPLPGPAPRPPQPGPGTTTCNPSKLLSTILSSTAPSKVTATTATTSDFFTIYILKQNK